MTVVRTDYPATTTIDPAGAALALIGPVRPGTRWTLRRCTVTASATTQGEVRLWRGTPEVGQFLDGSGSPAGDVSEWAVGVELAAGEVVSVAWTGCDPGLVVTATLSVDVEHIRGLR